VSSAAAAAQTREELSPRARAERYRAAAEAAPVYVDNGNQGASDAAVYRANKTNLWVVNRTSKALRTIDVECRLYAARADDEPADPKVLRHTIVGNIAAASDHYVDAGVPVPWDMLRLRASAQFVNCKVLATTEANAEQAQWAELGKRAAQTIARVDARAATERMDRARQQLRAEEQMDQVERFLTALQSANSSSRGSCQMIAQQMARERLPEVRRTQAVNGIAVAANRCID
jgi:hypothetical protein